MTTRTPDDAQLRKLYLPTPHEVSHIRVPKMRFLMVDGRGHPEGAPAFQEAIQALYSICYTMKFTYEKGHPIRDTRVGALEGLYWTRRSRRHPDLWLLDDDAGDRLRWTLMIRQPPPISRRHLTRTIEQIREQKGDLPGLARVRLEDLAEGWTLQIMHVGPYSEEKVTVARIHAHAEEHGFRLRGKHHEIYVSDPRRTSPEKLRTVLRQPVVRAR